MVTVAFGLMTLKEGGAVSLANVAVLAALGVHIELGLGREKRTLLARLRTVIWLVIAALAVRHGKRGQKAAL